MNHLYTLSMSQKLLALFQNKEFGFESAGSGGEMPFDVEEIDVIFVVYQDAIVQQARELEVKLTEKWAWFKNDLK